MFQDAALFPWLTVARNVELPLQFRKVGKADRRRRVSELLEMVHLDAFATKRPHELSGGMRQRVALARALAQDAPSCSWTSPSAPSTPSPVTCSTTSSSGCGGTPASPWSSSPTTSARPSASAIGS